MKEYTIQLIDCLCLIWEKKIFIIAGTIVSLVAGGVVSLRLPKIYRAEALISIGKKVNPSLGFPATYDFVDSTRNLLEYIPAMYELNEESLKYHIKIEEAGNLTMIKVSLEGPDRRRAKELLEEIVNKLIDEHLRVAENSLQPFRTYIETLKTDIKVFQENKSLLERKVEEMEAEKADPVAIVSLLAEIWDRKDSIRITKKTLLEFISAFDSLENYKTRVIGGIMVGKTPVKPKMKRNVIVTGIAGLWMSISLAFIIEYLRKIKEKKREG